jgi:malonate transporter and related proteins
MQTALGILPNFLLILVGLVLSRRFDYGRGFWDGLEKLVYYVLFPALLFRSLALAHIDLAKTGTLIAAACTFTAAGVVLSWLAKPVLRLDATLAATCTQCGFRFNTYVGLAVAGSLWGAPGVALAAILMGVLIPLVNLVAVGMLASHAKRGFGAEILRNPLFISTAAGFAWNAAGLPLPTFADQTLNLLAQTSLPAGLLSVGAALRVERGQGPIAAHAWWLTVKLVALPAIALGLIAYLGLQGVDAGILLLCAALPTASSAYILAVRMTGEGRAVATQITVGTLLSMLTIPIWLALLSGT